MSDPLIVFHFQTTKAGAVRFEGHNRTAYDCKLFEIERDGKICSKLFFGDQFAILEIAGHKITRIERQLRFFKKTIYKIFKHPGTECIGDIREPNWRARYKYSVNLNDTTELVFRKHNEHYSIFKPKTWNDYRYSLACNDFSIIYAGRNTRKKINNKKRWIFEGEIRTPDVDCMWEILAGLYLIEEDFRVISENSG